MIEVSSPQMNARVRTDAPARARLHTSDTSAPHPAPVFILAPPRSYTTVVTAMLGGHPQLYAFPELVLNVEDTVADLLESSAGALSADPAGRAQRMAGVVRALAQVHEGQQSDEACERAELWLRRRRDWTTEAVTRHLLRAVAPLVGIEKSPQNVTEQAFLRRCVDSFPDARFLHLTRHPITTQESMFEHWLFKPGTPGERRGRLTCASRWYLSHLRVVRALEAMAPDRWRRTKAEDVLRDPHTALPPLLEWLGVDRDRPAVTRMLDTGSWVYARPTGSRFGGGDPKFFARPEPRPPRSPTTVEFDPAWGLPPAMCERMTRLAHHLGY